MSDETPPPPLRLKPRQRSESDTPAAPTAPPPAPALTAVEPEEGKLRLKPKLIGEIPGAGSRPPTVAPPPPNSGTTPGTTPSANPGSAPPVGERIRLKPKLNAEAPRPATHPPMEIPAASGTVNLFPAPLPAPEEGKVKFKIRLPSAEGSAPPVEPAVSDAAEPPSLPAFPQVVPPPPDDDEIVVPPVLAAPAPGSPRPRLAKRPRVPSALIAAERRKKMIKYGMIALWGVVLAGAVIFGAYLKFAEPPERVRVPPRARVLPPVVPVVVTPLPPDKTELPPKVTTPVHVDPLSNTRVASTATIELAPGVTATTELVKAVRAASTEFRAFVATARINGVYQGTPPRAFINGRMVRTGEVVDSSLEITFDSVDLDTKSIVFKDASGATVSRRY